MKCEIESMLHFFRDPNSPGAEPDYENDKGSSNVWEMFDPVKQQYLSIGKQS